MPSLCTRDRTLVSPSNLSSHWYIASLTVLPREESEEHSDCVAAANLLEADIGDSTAAQKWRSLCASAFPHSRFFGGSKCEPLDSGFSAYFDSMTEAFGKLSFYN